MRSITAYLMALFILSASLYAESPTPSISYKKTFKKFLEISQSDTILKEINDEKNVKKLIDQITKGENIAKAKQDQITLMVRDTFSNITKELEDQMLLLYSKYYTEQDLNDLIVLYQTSTGKKLANNAVAIFNDSMEIAQAIVAQHIPKIEVKIQQIVAESKK